MDLDKELELGLGDLGEWGKEVSKKKADTIYEANIEEPEYIYGQAPEQVEEDFTVGEGWEGPTGDLEQLSPSQNVDQGASSLTRFPKFELEEEKTPEEEIGDLLKDYGMSVNDEKALNDQLVQDQLKNLSLNAKMPEIIDRETELLKDVLNKKAESILGSKPMRTSLLMSSSLGGALLESVFNVATGGSYLDQAEKIWAREYRLKSDEISDYKKLSKIYQDKRMGQMKFQQEYVKGAIKFLEMQEKLSPDNIDLKLQKATAIKEYELLVAKVKNEEDLASREQAKNMVKMYQDYMKKRIQNSKERIEREKLRQKMDIEKMKDATKRKMQEEKDFKASGMGQLDSQLRDPRNRYFGEKFASGRVDLKKADPKIREFISGYEGNELVRPKIMRQLSSLAEENPAGIGARFGYSLAKTRARFGMESNEQKQMLQERTQFVQNLKEYFSTVKETLGLGRLSDKDLEVILNQLGVREDASGGLLFPTAFSLSKVNLTKVQNAIKNINLKMRNKIYNELQPYNAETFKSVSKDEFIKHLTGGNQKPKAKTKQGFSPKIYNDPKKLLESLKGE